MSLFPRHIRCRSCAVEDSPIATSVASRLPLLPNSHRDFLVDHSLHSIPCFVMTSGPVEPVAAPAQPVEPAADDESSTRTNKVLVVGGDRVGKKYILQRLVNRPNLPTEPVTVDLAGSATLTVDTVVWPVETRYYSTSLQFHVLRDSSIPRFSPESLSSLLASPLLASTSSVVLVYDASDVDSLRAIQRWSAVTAQLDDEDSVMLCVGVEKAAGQGKEQVWDEAREWCIDHTIEHVRLRYEDDEARQGAAGGERRRDDDDDEEGISRIQSAFHANHWQHMTLKSRQAVAHSRLIGTDGDDGDEEQPLSINARLAQDEEREEAELEAHLQAEAEEEARHEAERQRMRAQLEAEGVKLDDESEQAGRGGRRQDSGGAAARRGANGTALARLRGDVRAHAKSEAGGHARSPNRYRTAGRTGVDGCREEETCGGCSHEYDANVRPG